MESTHTKADDMDEHSFYKEVLSWFFGIVFTISLFAARISFTRAAKRQDDQEANHKELEARVRELEKESVTHADLRRLEDKMDEQHRSITDRLDRILERAN